MSVTGLFEGLGVCHRSFRGPRWLSQVCLRAEMAVTGLFEGRDGCHRSV